VVIKIYKGELLLLLLLLFVYCAFTLLLPL